MKRNHSTRRFIRLAAVLLWSWLALSCAAAQPLTGAEDDYDALLSMIGNARIVMLGEDTHGSREFYLERERITRRLIEEAGFSAVVLEAPWEPARRLDAYIRGQGKDADAVAALRGFVRFPRWPTRNREMSEFVEALRAINLARAPGASLVRLYGMDLYSVPESADAVVRHLARSSIETARLARQRYACFDEFLDEPMWYGHEVEAGKAPSCAAGAAAQLAEMDAQAGDEDGFAAWQSARVARNGEDYYRTLYRKGEASWNLREKHMLDTLVQVLVRMGTSGKIVVWAHNSHQGDARETDQAAVGEVSLGQLMRERYGEEAVLIGFTTFRGRVRASAKWGGKDNTWRLRPALPGSWQDYLHRLDAPRSLLIFRGNPALAEKYPERRLERVVGVNYIRDNERKNHYFHARLSRQFDAVIHIDTTSALNSLP